MMKSAQEAVAEALRQLVEGRDFDPPEKMLASVSADSAVLIAPGCPYSIATNVAHVEQWQRSWLHRLQGLKPFDPWKDSVDFPVVDRSDWPAVRTAFVTGLKDALALAECEPFAHQCRDDVSAIRLLNKIAIHGAYHVGQVKLLKRIIRASTRKSA